MNRDLYCGECGKRVYISRPVSWEHPPGSGMWEMEDEGEWEDGAAECECCEKCFCVDCKDLDDGLCPECREETESEAEDDEGYIPL